MRRLLPLLLAGLALAPAALAAPAGPIFGLRAVGNPKLGYFVYPAGAGSVLHGAVTVTNTGDRAGTVKLFAADASTGATSGTVYLTDAAPADVGAWIALDTPSLTLAPGAHREVAFTVQVPAGATAGDHVGGIVAETVLERQGPQSANEANVQIKVRNLSIVAVQVSVPGPRVAKFTIGAVTAGGSQGRQQVVVHISNDGTTLAKPKGSVAITRPDGTTVETIPFQMDTFLPGTSIDYPVQLKQALPPGSYVAGVRMTYPGAAASGVQMSSAAPAFTVSEESVQRVFKPGKPTAVGPGVAGSAPASDTTLYKRLALGLGGLLLLSAVSLLVVLRRRRPVTVTAIPVAAPPAAARPLPAAPPPPRAPADERCREYHYWQVDWDHPEAAPDGSLAYPHVCRNCGVRVVATDIGDAAAKANALDP